ncbi:MAG TPA: hypothetical protein VLE95_06515 [Chlamydiales bacterium]|nr:hypothetical protein [Chlamydiales bacterium]
MSVNNNIFYTNLFIYTQLPDNQEVVAAYPATEEDFKQGGGVEAIPLILADPETQAAPATADTFEFNPESIVPIPSFPTFEMPEIQRTFAANPATEEDYFTWGRGSVEAILPTAATVARMCPCCNKDDGKQRRKLTGHPDYPGDPLVCRPCHTKYARAVEKTCGGPCGETKRLTKWYVLKGQHGRPVYDQFGNTIPVCEWCQKSSSK